MMAGAALLGLGLFFYLSGKFPGWGLGRLPGDFRIEGENYNFYLPFGTCIVLSILLTLIWSVISHFTRR